MTIASRIEDKLTAALTPLHLAVSDDSARHAGHAGARPGGETHFSVAVVSQRFEGMARPARHRLVYQALVQEFADGVHALSLSTLTPAEAARRTRT